MPTMAMEDRDRWATRVGFILAAVGSAVGLGNIWRFPFVTGEQGGAAFLLVYLLFVVLIGFPAILVEFVIGRRTDRNPVGALKQLATGPLRYAGYILVLTAFTILSYYSVVAGWTLRYAWIGVSEGYDDAIGNYEDDAAEIDASAAELLFDATSTGLDAMILHGLFMAIVVGIVALGIRRGIELAVKLMVPAIIVIALALVGYAFTLEGAANGYSYYLEPDFGVILSDWSNILPAAAGQAFFTLSLGMGVMITYASYLDEDRNLAEDSAVIIGLDTGIAFLMGLIVFPVLFTAGVDPADPGAGAIFVALAEAFADLSFGWLIGTVFFLTVAIGAISSAISILEVVVSHAIDDLGIDRTPAAAGVGGIAFVIGLLVAWDLIFLDLLDQFADDILLVLGALIVMTLVSWKLSDLAIDELQKGIADLGSWGMRWIWAVRVPILIVLVISLALGVIEYVEFLFDDEEGFAAWLADL